LRLEGVAFDCTPHRLERGLARCRVAEKSADCQDAPESNIAEPSRYGDDLLSDVQHLGLLDDFRNVIPSACPKRELDIWGVFEQPMIDEAGIVAIVQTTGFLDVGCKSFVV